MTTRFATYFDSRYAAKGIAMIRSLLAHCDDAEIDVLCFDETIRDVLTAWFGSKIRTIQQDELSRYEPRLVPLQETRSTWEFYATHKPVLMKRLIQAIPPGDLIAYIDADVLFFSDPRPLFEEMNDASIGLSPHRFSRRSGSVLRRGPYNAGFGIWRNDDHGRRSLADWTEQCLDWCKRETPGDGRYMNQGYLRDWPTRYERVRVLSHSGENVAPWNIAGYRLSLDRDQVHVDEQPLIFFHYSNLLFSRDMQWVIPHSRGFLNNPAMVLEIYAPYVRQLEEISAILWQRNGIRGLETAKEFKKGVVHDNLGQAIHYASGPFARFRLLIHYGW